MSELCEPAPNSCKSPGEARDPPIFAPAIRVSREVSMNASAESTSVSWARYVLWGLLALTLALTVASYWWSGRHAQQDQRFVRLVDRQHLLSQALARHALAAAGGEATAFQRLEAVRDAMAGGLAELGLAGDAVPAGHAAIVTVFYPLCSSGTYFFFASLRTMCSSTYFTPLPL